MWDQLTAIGTMALATVTVGLVAATYALVRQSVKQTRAAWLPVLLLRQWDRRADGTDEWAITWDGWRIDVLVANVGAGPALDVSASLDSEDATFPTALASGETTWFSWQDITARAGQVSGRITYTDVAGEQHATEFELEFEGQPNGRINWQRTNIRGL